MRPPTKWTQETVIEAAHRWYNHYGRQPLSTEWNSQKKLRVNDKHLQEYTYPYTYGVMKLFGSWNNMISAAGFEIISGPNGPRKPATGSKQRRRTQRNQEIMKLVQQGHTDTDAARIMGVGKDTVRKVRLAQGVHTKKLSINSVVSEMFAQR